MAPRDAGRRKRPADCRNPTLDIVRRNECDRFAVVRAEHFAQHREVGDHHRQPGHAGLDGGEPECLPDRGKHEQIRGGIEIGNVVGWQSPEPMQPVIDAEGDGQRVKRLVLGAGSGENEMRLRQTSQRPNEHVLVLLPGEAADIEQNGLRGR